MYSNLILYLTERDFDCAKQVSQPSISRLLSATGRAAIGAPAVKNPKREHRLFTRVEKEILEERFNKTQLDDKKGREEVAALLSSSGKPLSAEQVRIWVDNFKASLKKKKDGEDNQSAPNDKE